MHPPAKNLLDALQGTRHPPRNRVAPQPEAPIPSLRATVREAQKVERLRFALPCPPVVFSGIPSELDEPRLFRVHFQFKASQPPFHGLKEALRIPPVLKTHHEIIGVPHDDCVATDFVLAPLLLEPQIEDVVQVNVRQDRGNHRALGRPPQVVPPLCQLP